MDEKKCIISDHKKIAVFKSKPEHWNDEFIGIKPYTIRKFDNDDRFDDDVTHIMIINSDTGKSFIREKTHKLAWDGWFIFAWNPNIRI